jgi:hypothetical protein
MSEEMADVLGVPRADFQKVTVVAGHVMDFEHFGTLGERACDGTLARRLFALDGDEGEHRQVRDVSIEQGRVALDDPARFELPDAFEDRRGSQADRPAYLCLSDPGVGLKKRQYLRVYLVNGS